MGETKMIGYILKREVQAKEAEKKLKSYLNNESILEIGINEKNEPFVRTDWYIYITKLNKNTVKVPVIWSQSKKPYLIGGILMVLFCLFFVGGVITDFVVIGVLVGLGLVNVVKRREINDMKHAICEALDQ